MIPYVESGSKVLAEQYNTLVDAIAGPINPNNETPFVQTKNGTLTNGGLTASTTKAPSRVPLFLETQFSTGSIFEGYSAYRSEDEEANRFTGVFLNVGPTGNFMESICRLSNGNCTTSAILVIIDPTNDSLATVPYNTALNNAARGRLPICTVDKDAALAIVQVVAEGSGGDESRAGDILAIAGDWTKAGASQGNRPLTVPRQTIINIVKNLNVYADTTDARILSYCTLWKGTTWIGPNIETMPRLTYNVGTQEPNLLPDTYASTGVYNNMSLSTLLSSVNVVPQKQVGFNVAFTTNTFELYNFDKYPSDYYTLSALQHAPNVDGSPGGDNQISAFDVLVKHKAPHPRGNSSLTGYANQAQARLEYVSLSALLSGQSSCISGDFNVTQGARGSIETIYNEELSCSYHQLYNWDNDGPDGARVLSAAYGQTKYWSIGGGGSASEGVMFLRKDADKYLHYDLLGISIPKVDSSACSEEFLSAIISAAGMDTNMIKQLILQVIGSDDGEDALTDQLDDQYWKLGGGSNNCYGSAIGNSNKGAVIDLDGTKLKNTGTNSIELDWSLGRCIASDTNTSLHWDNRELVDSNGTTTLYWDTCKLYGPTSQNYTLNWDNKQLIGNWGTANGNFTVNGFLQIGNTQLTENQLQALLQLI